MRRGSKKREQRRIESTQNDWFALLSSHMFATISTKELGDPEERKEKKRERRGREREREREREERPGILISHLGQRLTEVQNGRLALSQTLHEYSKHDRQWVPLLSSNTCSEVVLQKTGIVDLFSQFHDLLAP